MRPATVRTAETAGDVRDWLLRDVPDFYDARRMARRLLRFMLRAGWTVGEVYGIAWDGGFTTTARVVKEGREVRLSVDADRWCGFADGCWIAVRP